MGETGRQHQHSEGFSHALALVGAGATARAVTRICVSVCALLTTALVVRLLGEQLFGALAFGLSIVGLVAGLFAGFTIAAERTLAARLATGDRDGADVVTGGLIAIVTVSGALGLAILVAVIALTQDQLETAEAVIVGIGLGVLVIGRICAAAAEGIARGYGRIVLMELPRLVEVVSKLLLVLALAALALDALGPVALAYGAAGVFAAISAVAVTRLAQGEAAILKPISAGGIELLRLAGPYALAAIAYRIIQGFDVAILGAIHPGAPVGSYAPTLTLVETLVGMVPVLLSAIFVSAATTLIESGDRAGFTRLYVTVAKISIAASMPAFVLLELAPVETVQFVFGSRLSVSQSVVRVLLVGYFVTVAVGFNGQSLVASGERLLLWRAFVWPGITMLATSVILIPPLEALGAAIATTVSFVVLNLSLSWGLYRATGAHPGNVHMLLLIGTTPVAFLMAHATRGVVGDRFWGIVLAVTAGWLLWLVLVFTIRALSLAEIRGIVPRRRRSVKPGE